MELPRGDKTMLWQDVPYAFAMYIEFPYSDYTPTCVSIQKARDSCKMQGYTLKQLASFELALREWSKTKNAELQGKG
jgi:hypothetical protein